MWKATKHALVTAAALLWVLGPSGTASAFSIDLVWSGSGTNVTTADWAGSATLTLDVYATLTVPPGLSGLTVSLSYDPAALSLVSCTMANKQAGAWVAGGYFQPYLVKAAVCDTSTAGIVGGMNQFASPPYLPYLPGPGSLPVAQLQFHVSGLAFGNSVVQSFFDPAYDGWSDNNYVFSQDANLGSATARLVPEPATVLFVGLGFLGLVAAGRRKPRGDGQSSDLQSASSASVTR